MEKKSRINEFYRKKSIKLKIQEFSCKRRNENILFRICDNLRIRSFNYLKQLKISHRELLGCNLDELRIHLESKFKEGMTFENYGEWEIDHIKPISKFNLEIETEIIECFNYKNIQPLWKTENRKKSNIYYKK